MPFFFSFPQKPKKVYKKQHNTLLSNIKFPAFCILPTHKALLYFLQLTTTHLFPLNTIHFLFPKKKGTTLLFISIQTNPASHSHMHVKPTNNNNNSRESSCCTFFLQIPLTFYTTLSHSSIYSPLPILSNLD